VTADLFGYEPERPFHAIISRQAYQGLPPRHREELARRFFRWLHPGGTAIVETINIRQPRTLERPFLAAGFRKPKRWPPGEDGRKNILFSHGSG
jgi:hypothetical protein